MLAFFAALINESSMVIETHQPTNLHKLQKQNSFVRAANTQETEARQQHVC